VTAAADETGDGEVTITEVNAVITPAPEPASIAPFAVGLLGLGFIFYRRRKTTGPT
jgi:hypothetical protein